MFDDYSNISKLNNQNILSVSSLANDIEFLLNSNSNTKLFNLDSYKAFIDKRDEVKFIIFIIFKFFCVFQFFFYFKSSLQIGKHLIKSIEYFKEFQKIFESKL